MNSFWFIWNGKNSLSDYGLWIRKMPKHTRAKERHEEIVIPGRPGSLILPEGDDVYDAYRDEITVSCKNNIDIDRVKEWLRGSGELILSDDINKARVARIVNEVRFDRDDKEKLFIGTIPFLFQPFRKSVYPQRDRVTITTTPDYVYNNGDVISYPIVSITGSGDNTITIAGNAMTFANLSGTVVVDCGAQMITKNGNVWTKAVTGNFWILPPGRCNVSQTGNATIKIDPEMRWL